MHKWQCAVRHLQQAKTNNTLLPQALGEPAPFPNPCAGPDMEQGVSANLHNNVWGTNVSHLACLLLTCSLSAIAVHVPLCGARPPAAHTHTHTNASTHSMRCGCLSLPTTRPASRSDSHWRPQTSGRQRQQLHTRRLRTSLRRSRSLCGSQLWLQSGSTLQQGSSR